MKTSALKRLICMMLALVMVFSLVACGNKEDPNPAESEKVETNATEEKETEKESDATEEVAEEEIGTDPITVTMSGPQGVTDDWNGTSMIASIKEMTNVTIDCQPYADDAWQNKMALMLAEDDLPDIIINPGMNLADVGDYGEQGYFLAINEYLEYMPNLATFLEAYPDYAMYCTSPDGNIYTLLNWTDNYYNGMSRNFINERWLDALGLEAPKTVDELYDVLIAFRDNDPNGNGEKDEIPLMFSGTYARNPLQALLPAFGIMDGTGVDNIYGVWQVNDAGEVYLADTTDNYKAYLTYLNKLWEEGLLYNESYSTEITAQRELTKANRVGVFADAGAHVATGGPSSDVTFFQMFGAYTSEWNESPVVPITSAVNNTPQILFSAASEHPERILQVIDMFFSEEYYMCGKYGFDSIIDLVPCEVEGFTEFVSAAFMDAPEGYESIEAYRHKAVVINESFDFLQTMYGTNEWMVVNGDQSKLEDLALAGLAVWGVCSQERINAVGAELVEEFPGLVYSADIASEYSSLNTDITTYLQTATAQFITGEKDIETEWDAHLAMLEQMQLSRLQEIQQDAYDTLTGK